MKTNLEILLGEWGRLQAGQNKTGLGYPSCAAFTHERVQQSSRDDVYVLMADDDIRRLECEITRLHPDMRTILTAHYVWSGPLKCKLPRLALSKSQFYFKLDCAHQHLSHTLGGRYEFGYEPILSRHVAEVSRSI